MYVIIILSALLVVFAAWFLTRPAKGRLASDEGQIALELMREETLKQLREIDSDRIDGRIDEAIARDETRRLEYELAQVLRSLQSAQASAKPASRGLSRRGLIALFFLVALPALAGGLDYWQNKPALLTFAGLNGKGQMAGVHGFPPMVLSMVAKLRRHLEKHPRNTAGWLELARAYVVLGNLTGAEDAYAHAYKLAPDDEAVLANYAWLLYSSNPAQTSGLVNTLFHRLYVQDPDQQDALWFLGLAAYNRRHFHQTLMYWSKLEGKLPPGSKARVGVESAVRKIKAILVAKRHGAIVPPRKSETQGTAQSGAGVKAP